MSWSVDIKNGATVAEVIVKIKVALILWTAVFKSYTGVTKSGLGLGFGLGLVGLLALKGKKGKYVDLYSAFHAPGTPNAHTSLKLTRQTAI